MTVSLSVDVRNARLDAIETEIGAGAVLKIRSGAPPAGIGDPDAGTVLATVNLPSDWLAAASSGVKSKSGTWQDTSADASGTAGHFRIYAADGTTQHMQGTITASGGGGDMELNNTVLAAGQEFTVTSFSMTEGNA